MEYNKLVRDRIPEIIAAEGKSCQVEVMDEAAFQLALRQKLVEEAIEAAEAGADLVKEIADLYEVIDTLIRINGLDKHDILVAQEQRRNERGSFDKQIQLLEVKD